MAAETRHTNPPPTQRRQLTIKFGRWLDSYLVWHSPQLAVAAMQAMTEKHRNDRARSGVGGGVTVECRGPYLAVGCAGAVHRQADI